MAAVLVLAMNAVCAGDDWSRSHAQAVQYSQKQAYEQHKLYDRGFRDGRKDRQHHRQYRIRDRGFSNRRNREAYVEGYHAGYGSGVYRR
jgi:hypothetical protein